MSMGFKTSSDGTLLTTIGKKLVKSIKVKAVDMRTPLFLPGPLKEVTFAIIPSVIFFYANKKEEDYKLTIDNKCSIEATINASWIQAPMTTPDNTEFEVWLWN